MSKVRLQKALAQMGFGSRRHLESLVSKGRITINHQTAHLGQILDPEIDEVTIDGQIVSLKSLPLYYILLNKPPGVISSRYRQDATPVVTDLVKTPVALYPVGRLDKDSQGLLLLTNDGQLTFRLTHPRYHVAKTYQVTVTGRCTPTILSRLESGILFDGHKTSPCQINIISNTNKDTKLNWVLSEGKNRQIRRMAAAVGLTVIFLKRIQMGPLTLGHLALGKSRPLTPTEIHTLKAVVDL